MTPAPKQNWSATNTSAIVGDYPAPSASISLLLQACRFPLAVATMPYAGCARVFDGLAADRYLTLRLAPASVHARAAIGITSTSLQDPAVDTEIWTTDGGSSGVNVIKVKDTGQTQALAKAFAFDAPVSTLLVSSAGIDDSPTAAKDRQLELTTDDSPVNEQAYVKTASSFSVCVTERADLETI
tara:strand:- start:3109 stop:3660 length:552 start_codon:yes stop_codon:yes gene_type:complete